MTLYQEVLPDTKSERGRGFQFHKLDYPTDPVVGTLTIESVSRRTEFLVEQFSPGCPGAAFQLSKLGGDLGASDDEETGYAVFCDPRGRCSCECKGFRRHGHCRHAETVAACVKEGWL